MDPTKPALIMVADRGRECAVGAYPDLLAKSYVRHEHGEKLDRCDELVIVPQSRVELAALVVDHPVIAIGKSPERNGWSFDVLEEGLEGFPIAHWNSALSVQMEARVVSAAKRLHAFGGDRLAFEHHLESLLPTVSFRRNAPRAG